MKQHGVLCGMLLLLLLCMNVVHGFNVGSPRRLMSESSDSNDPASSTLTSEWFHPTYPHSTPTPTVAPTPTPGPTPTPTPKPHPPPSQGGPIGNFFKCAKGFKLVKFCVKEIYVTNSTSEIFSLETHEQIGTAAGNCPDIPGTVSPTGSGQALQSCVFTYNFFNRGRLVETGTFDPSPNGVSNNAVTGIDGEFFQALGLEHIRNFADGSGGLDEFFICEPIVKICEQEKKEHDHDGDHHDHDGDDGKNEHHKHDGDEYHP